MRTSVPSPVTEIVPAPKDSGFEKMDDPSVISSCPFETSVSSDAESLGV